MYAPLVKQHTCIYLMHPSTHHKTPPHIHTQELLGTSEDDDADSRGGGGAPSSSKHLHNLLTKTGRRLKLDTLADKLDARQAAAPTRKEELLLGRRLAKVRGAAAGAAERLFEGAKDVRERLAPQRKGSSSGAGGEDSE